MPVGRVGEDDLEKAEAALEAFEPSVAPRKIVLRCPDAGGNLRDVTFVQEPLGYFPTQELGTLITRVGRDVMGGKYGVDVGELLRDRKRLSAAQVVVEHDHGGEAHSHVVDFGSMDAEQIAAMTALHDLTAMADETTGEFIDAVAHLSAVHEHVSHDVEAVYNQWRPYIEGFLQIMDDVPGLQQEIIALSLGVRRRDREAFKEQISEAPQYGGLSIDEGVEIVKFFIRQNAVAIRRFLAQQLREIGEEIMEAVGDLIVGQDADSSGTTPSSTSSAPTQG